MASSEPDKPPPDAAEVRRIRQLRTMWALVAFQVLMLVVQVFIYVRVR